MSAPDEGSLRAQTRTLLDLVQRNPVIAALFERTPALGLPDWCLGAGAVAQTVWNILSGRDSGAGIVDYDLVYFDPTDLSKDAELNNERAVQELVAELAVSLDVKNEARVHLWYEKRYGRAIEPYRSLGDAIRTWPTTATCIGIRAEDGGFDVYAPFGLSDLLGMVVRPNKTQITQSVYEAKVERWIAVWPTLTVVPWHDDTDLQLP
ncbi:MAG: hypothetical protein JWO68_1702 [Actinomycetia bacterium]|nr:hypothetical protein [Actinomycetes bacterium]